LSTWLSWRMGGLFAILILFKPAGNKSKLRLSSWN
jgi:hypothetical protein